MRPLTALGALIEQASDARALVLTLAQVLAGYEDRTDRSFWRNVRGTRTAPRGQARSDVVQSVGRRGG